MREFQSQLEDLGKRLGRKSPVAWAYAIVKNLSFGNPCTYWEEFKAGIPLGTSEQREWEIAPGVACSIAIQCLQQDYLARPGTTPQEAARKAAQTIARPKEMAAVWESIKSQVMFRRLEWERQSALGVETPMLDSWMVPRQPVTVEEVAIALNEIQSALPEVLKSKSIIGHSQELQPLQSQEKSALSQIDPNQELVPAAPIAEEVEIKSAIGDKNPETNLVKALPDATVTDYGTLQRYFTPQPQIEATVEVEQPTIEGAAVESQSIVEDADPYAPTAANREARDKARSQLKNKYGKPTKAEAILAANIAEIAQSPAVEFAKVVISKDCDDEPILW